MHVFHKLKIIDKSNSLVKNSNVNKIMYYVKIKISMINYYYKQWWFVKNIYTTWMHFNLKLSNIN